MKTRIVVYGLMFLIQLIFCTWGILGQAQEDRTMVLIGTWQGTVAKHDKKGTGKDGRTIIIKSVKPKEGEGWIAVGSFGRTGQTLKPLTYDVSLHDGKIVLRFTVEDHEGYLTLVSDRKLEGTLQFMHSGGRNQATRLFLELEKID